MTNHNRNRSKWLNKDIDYLFKAITKLQSTQDCEKFFRDLLTINEIKSFAERLKVANMLNKGSTYKQIEKKTGASSTTIARINRWLEYGEGGYKLILRRMKNIK